MSGHANRSPCGRGLHGRAHAKNGEGSIDPTPHPTEATEALRFPLPQGARAHLRRSEFLEGGQPRRMMTKAAEEGSKETYRSPSARAGRTRQKFFHFDRNAVAAHYDSAL